MWYTRNIEGKWFRLVLGVALWFLYACNSENAPDCLQNTGDLVRDEVVLPPFDKITVFEEVALVLREGAEQRVEIQTGEFLRDEVTAMVEGDRLLLRNTNGCNLFRSYGETVVFVTAPNITEIRSSTGRTIRSEVRFPIRSFPSYRKVSRCRRRLLRMALLIWNCAVPVWTSL